MKTQTIKPKMKTPISYYGGKQSMLKHILPMIPEHRIYIDPPYVGAHQGHYGGYTQEHFNQLLDTLSRLQGKFILSSYPNDELTQYREKYGWNSNDIQVRKSGKAKVEALTYNYEI